MNVTADPRKPRLTTPPPEKRRTGLWVWLIVAAVVAGAVYFIIVMRPAQKDATGMGGRQRGGAGGYAGRGQKPASVVTAEAVKQGDLPDYITALGTVTALNTAIVHSRVDGQLVKINFEEGQKVKQGDVLAEIDPRPFQVALQQAQGQLARDQATLENARQDFSRYQEAREAVTQQQVDLAKSTVAQTEGLVKADEATVASNELQLSFCQIVAPIDGVVGLRPIDVGNLVHSADVNGVAVITQVQPIAVRFSIPEDTLPGLTKAIALGLKLPADIFDRSMSKKIASGSLAAIDNQIDTTTGTLRIKAVIPNDDLALFPNQFVNVRLLVNIEKGVLLIPTSAVQMNGADNFVYVVGDDSTVHRKPVKIGNAEGLNTVVSDGVALGDKVVTEGLDRLQDDTPVIVRAAGDISPVTSGPSDKSGAHHGWKHGQGQKGKPAPAAQSSGS